MPDDPSHQERFEMNETVPASGPSVRDVIDNVAVQILEYGRGWMLDPATIDRANSLGLEGVFGFWINGRAGVLGDVDSDVAASANRVHAS